MKKFFTLLMASASILCANAATSLSFNVTTAGNVITVNPTDQTATYFAAVLDEYTMNIWSYMGGTVNNPDMLFTLASNVYDTNIFTGAYSYEAEGAGDYVIVAVAAYKDQAEDAIVATDQIFIQTVTIGSTTPGDEEPEVGNVDLTFTFQSHGTSFTLTPSDQEQLYFMWVFSQDEEAEAAEELDATIEELFLMYAQYASEYDVMSGTTTQDGDADWYFEDEYGTYYVLAVPVRQEGRKYTVCGNVSKFDWQYTDTPTAIATLTQSANRVAKAMLDGRIILKGRYGVNGAIVK